MEAKNNTEAENMFRAALSRYSQNYEKAIKNIEGHRKAGKDILFGERICRSAFIFMIWLFTAAIIQTETVLPVKKNTITIIVTVAAVIAWVALLNGKHCLEHRFGDIQNEHSNIQEMDMPYRLIWPEDDPADTERIRTGSFR